MTVTSSDIIEEIAIERQRQKEKEGWTKEHDDEHTTGQLAAAAACYAFASAVQAHGDEVDSIPSIYWPWDREWWKPRDPRRNLVRAAALIVAEIERLDRAHLLTANPVREPKL